MSGRPEPSKQGLVVIALLSMGMNLLTRLVGFGFQAGIAYRLGTSLQADAFLLASTIPAIVYTVVCSIISVALVPTFQRSPSRRNLGRAFIWASVAGLVGALHPLLIKTSTPLEFTLSVAMVPSLPIAATCGVLMAWHFAQGRYLFVPFTIFLNNVASLITLVLGLGLDGAWMGVWGFNAGWGLQLGSLVIATLFTKPKFGQSNETALRFRVTAAQVWPLLVTQIALHLPFIGARYLVAGMDPGTISAYSYAVRLVTFPASIISSSILGAAYPAWTELWENGEISRSLDLAKKATRLIVFLLIPTVVFATAGAEPIVSLLFERGAFTHEDAVRTAVFMRYVTAAMFGVAVWDVAIRLLHTQGKRMTALKVVTSLSVITIAVEWTAAQMGFPALAIVSGSSTLVTALVLLSRVDRSREFAQVYTGLRAMVVPALVLTIISTVLVQLAGPVLVSGSTIKRLVWLSAFGIGSLGCWVVSCWICGVEEVLAVVTGLRYRISGRTGKTKDIA